MTIKFRPYYGIKVINKIDKTSSIVPKEQWDKKTCDLICKHLLRLLSKYKFLDLKTVKLNNAYNDFLSRNN